LFIDLLSDTKGYGVQSSQAANIAVFNILKNTKLELVGSIVTGLRLALRNDSTKHIDYYHGSKELIPSYDEVLIKTKEVIGASKLLNRKQEGGGLHEDEKISGEIAGENFKIISVFFSGRHKKYKMGLGSQIFHISLKQKELFHTLYHSDINSAVMNEAEYQTYMQLKRIFPENIISFFETKRLKKRQAKKEQERSEAHKTPKKEVKERITRTPKRRLTAVPHSNRSSVNTPYDTGLHSSSHQRSEQNMTPISTPSNGKGISEGEVQVGESKKEVILPEVKSKLESDILDIFMKNTGKFYTYDDIARMLDMKNDEDFKMKFLLIKSKFNNINGEKILERQEKGWYLLPELEDIHDREKIEIKGPTNTSICYYSKIFGVFLSEDGDIIFQNKNIEDYAKVTRKSIQVTKGRYMRRNTDTLRLKFRKFFPGITVGSKGIRYKDESNT
ncbi:hypothetical protein LAT59_05135, partial [Candidatus Gracilibacteria bacterium]|nr:hypothetical protein [Candidatus Gracilibacteria bacterium]